MNDRESLETFDARREKLKAQKMNGDGMGTPLATTAPRQLQTPQTGQPFSTSTRNSSRRTLETLGNV